MRQLVIQKTQERKNFYFAPIIVEFKQLKRDDSGNDEDFEEDLMGSDLMKSLSKSKDLSNNLSIKKRKNEKNIYQQQTIIGDGHNYNIKLIVVSGTGIKSLIYMFVPRQRVSIYQNQENVSNVKISNDGFSATIETTYKSFEGKKIYELLDKLNLITDDYDSFLDKAVKNTSFSSNETQIVIVNFPFAVEKKNCESTESWHIFLLEERKPELEENIVIKKLDFDLN